MIWGNPPNRPLPPWLQEYQRGGVGTPPGPVPPIGGGNLPQPPPPGGGGFTPPTRAPLPPGPMPQPPMPPGGKYDFPLPPWGEGRYPRPEMPPAPAPPTRRGSQMIGADGQVIGHYGNDNQPVYNPGQEPQAPSPWGGDFPPMRRGPMLPGGDSRYVALLQALQGTRG